MLATVRDFFSGLLSPKKTKGKKRSGTIRSQVEAIPLGSYVSLTFIHPSKLGVIDPSGVITKRYDPEDLNTCKLTGALTNRFPIENFVFVELSSFKMKDGAKRERIYTLMIDEIVDIKVVT